LFTALPRHLQEFGFVAVNVFRFGSDTDVSFLALIGAAFDVTLSLLGL